MEQKLDLIWGINNIAAALGRTRTQTYPLLAKGILPAKQVNRRWVITREALDRFFRDLAA